MELTKKQKVVLIIIVLLVCPFIFYKLQGTKIYWLRFEDEIAVKETSSDIFIVQNPPDSEEELIKLIEKMNDTMNLKSRINKKSYVQSFYKETFNLTRFYKPHYSSFIGTPVDIRSDNAQFIKELLVDYVYNDDDENCGMWCPIPPYYIFYNEQGAITSEYYPKGLKNNPDKHWDIRE